MDYRVVHVMEHYEVYINGMFICSGDTWNEAIMEADKALTERR